jgi:hypothetical protein
MSLRNFAVHTNLSTYSISDMEAKGKDTKLRPSTQRILDNSFATAPEEARRRFYVLLEPAALGSGNIVAVRETDNAETGRSSLNRRRVNGHGTAAQSSADPAGVGVLAVSWESDLAHVRRTAVRLWATDLDRFRAAEPDTAAPHVVALRWLVAGPEVTTARGGSGRRVGQADVERLRSMRCQLKAMDNAHGGGVAFPMAVTYLRREATPLLNGRYADATGRQLCGAVAGLTLDVGWMAYDAGDHRLARAYLGHALRLSHAADDRLFGGRVLAALSHQALHIGQTALAIDCARAARTGTAQIAPPRAVAMLAAMEAMALAAGRDATACQAALRDAEAAVEQDHVGDGPEWLDFDVGGMYGHAARAYRYLRRGTDCARFAGQAIAACQPEHSRTRAQRYAILAAAHVQSGELEQAAVTGSQIVRVAWNLHSRHVDEEIIGLAKAIRRRNARSGQEFLDQAREYLTARAA